MKILCPILYNDQYKFVQAFNFYRPFLVGISESVSCLSLDLTKAVLEIRIHFRHKD